MPGRDQVNVAILLATYNGEEFVAQQIRSLKDNTTPFTLHWLDDHSTDNTRAVVRSTVRSLCLDLKEWHTDEREGVPGAFFRLLESVESDVYLFCDQDDLWQSGKIDVTVQNLLQYMPSPTLCFSEPLLFRDGAPGATYRLSEVIGTTLDVALEDSRLFMPATVVGHTQGFTRALRDLFAKHSEIARRHAIMHDAWIYLIAVASGRVRMLQDAPTTLFRRHKRNATHIFSSWTGTGAGHLSVTWSQHQMVRRLLAREAHGFILASKTLPPGPQLERSLTIARQLERINHRQSPAAAFRMIKGGVMWPNIRNALGLALTCILSDAGS